MPPTWRDEHGHPLLTKRCAWCGTEVPISETLHPAAALAPGWNHWCGHGEELLRSPWGLLPVLEPAATTLDKEVGPPRWTRRWVARKVRIIVAVALAAFGLYLDNAARDTDLARAVCIAVAQVKEAWARAHPGPGDERQHRLAACRRRVIPQQPKPWIENSESRVRPSPWPTMAT